MLPARSSPPPLPVSLSLQNQGGKNRYDECDRQRNEQPTRNSPESEQRQKNKDDRKGGKNDRRAHLDRSFEDDLQARQRRGCVLILMQAAADVFDVDDRIVGDAAQRDRQSAQRKGVQAQSECVQLFPAAHGISSVRATRKPTALTRSTAGVPLTRAAERRYCALLFQEPPRRTR